MVMDATVQATAYYFFFLPCSFTDCWDGYECAAIGELD